MATMYGDVHQIHAVSLIIGSQRVEQTQRYSSDFCTLRFRYIICIFVLQLLYQHNETNISINRPQCINAVLSRNKFAAYSQYFC